MDAAIMESQLPAAGAGRSDRENMPSGLLFGQRNLYYLRVSPYTVIQMLLYLDVRHVAWMNEEGEEVLPAVMELLRPMIMPKLRAEVASAQQGLSSTSNRRARVDVEATEDFRVAYFFRKVTARHAVLLKDYVLYQPAAGQPPRESQPPPPADESSALRPGTIDEEKEEGQDQDQDDDDDDDDDDDLAALHEAEAAEAAERRSRQPISSAAFPPAAPSSHKAASLSEIRVKQEDADDDPVFLTMNQPEPPTGLDLTDDVTAPTPELGPGPMADPPQDVKPSIRVKYSGFNIFGKMLVVVVEPTQSSIARAPHLFADDLLGPGDRGSVPPWTRGGGRGKEGSRSQSAVPTSKKRRLEEAWDAATSTSGKIQPGRELSATPYTAEERERFREQAEERKRIREASIAASLARRSESVAHRSQSVQPPLLRGGSQTPLFRGSSQTPSEAGWARAPTPGLPDASEPGRSQSMISRGGSVLPVGGGWRAPSGSMPPPPLPGRADSHARSRYSRLSHSPSPTPGASRTLTTPTTPRRSTRMTRSATPGEAESPVPEDEPTLEEDSRAFELASQMLDRPDVGQDDARAVDEEE